VHKTIDKEEAMRVLTTAGPVYGHLDDMKVVSNKARGIWAIRFAQYLHEMGWEPILLIPDTLQLHDKPGYQVIKYSGGFDKYLELCHQFAPNVHAAIMAAAVVNWIPDSPFPGKIPTADYREGDTITVKLKLAHRVINDMKAINPKLTLIGCKLTARATENQQLQEAWKVLINARCNAVVVNDITALHHKTVLHQDMTRLYFDNEFDALYTWLVDLITDEHYTTEIDSTKHIIDPKYISLFNAIVAENRQGFTPRPDYGAFGAVAVRLPNGKFLVSPREKGRMFQANEAVIVHRVCWETRRVFASAKASLNTPLLIKHLRTYPEAPAVLHQHRQLPDVETAFYYPPGTERDNNREILGPKYNIAGHGFVATVNKYGYMQDV